MRLFEFDNHSSKVESLKQFVGWAIDRIGIENAPKIKFGTDRDQVRDRRTFGSTSGSGDIWVHIANRNTADIMRTLMHELIHHKQFEQGTAHGAMTEDEEQYIEDEANAIAGRLMREYGKKHEDIYENKKMSRPYLNKSLINTRIRKE
jgi:Zn-dependent peptidase ImmA (M78 family)